MPRMLVRSGKDPRQVVAPEAALARNGWGVFGANIGNLLFQTSLFRAVSVPGTEVVTDSLLGELGRFDDDTVDRINAEFDAYVLPLANAFRGQFVTSLKRLTALIDRLTIPVVLVGVGAQFKPGRDISSLPDEVNDASRRFIAAVLDHSSSIGVRGEVTKGYLQQLGFPAGSIDVIGCPSLYLNGAGLRIDKPDAPLTADSRLAMNVTPSAVAMAPLIEHATSSYPNLTYIPQEHTDLAMMLWREERDPRADPRIPARLDHPLYTQDRMRFFLDSMPWIEFLRGQQFAFGSRVHGNIAALLAGTPAFIVAHDSRTRELAEYHGIPYRSISDIGEDTTVADLYDEADYTEFNARHSAGFERYTAFLDRNGIRHIFTADPSGLATDFDRDMAAAAFPGPVGVAAVDAELQQVYDRLRWLRQGGVTDRTRTVGAYRPPFGADASPKPVTAETVARLEARVAQLAAEVERLRAAGSGGEQRSAAAERHGGQGSVPRRLAGALPEPLKKPLRAAVRGVRR